MSAQATGILMIDPHGRGLFVLRSDSEVWATPAGHKEKGESWDQAAVREIFEETGYSGPLNNLRQIRHTKTPEREFVLFAADVPAAFAPRLDYEHLAYIWKPLSDPPNPLHWGLQWLKRKSP